MTQNDNLVIRGYFEGAAGYWEDIYRHTDVYALIHQERRRLIVQMIDKLGLPQGARVLEVGCGAGHLAIHLAGRGFRVAAIDAAGAMVEATRERAIAAGFARTLSVHLGEAAHLSFRTAEFDLVVAIGVLPWMSEVGPSLAEIARVAKPGGAVLLTMDNRWALHRVLDPRLSPPAVSLKRLLTAILTAAGLTAPKARARTLSVRAFGRYLSRAGLRLSEGRTLGFGPFTFWNRKLIGDQAGANLHHRLQRAADRGSRLLGMRGAQYLVLARREGSEEIK